MNILASQNKQGFKKLLKPADRSMTPEHLVFTQYSGRI